MFDKTLRQAGDVEFLSCHVAALKSSQSWLGLSIFCAGALINEQCYQ